MTVVKLFHVYHSFFMKKWLLIVYCFLFIVAILAVVAIFAPTTQNEKLSLAVVDEDDSSETKLILETIDGGKQFSSTLYLIQSTKVQAQKKLESHEIDGYIVLRKGMTASFYNNGNLPIDVFLYDQDSMKSILIEQVATSAYERLLKSEAGILTYDHFYKNAADYEVITMMMSLFFTGLDTQKVFDQQLVPTIEPLQYATVSIYMASIFSFFVMMSLVLQMNLSIALTERLSMYRFVKEKMILAKYSFVSFYTFIYALIMFFVIAKTQSIAFQSYNWTYLMIDVVTYIMYIAILFIISECIEVDWLTRMIQIVCACCIFIFSGMLFPTIYLSQTIEKYVQYLPFTQIFDSVLKLMTLNYVTTWHESLFIIYVILVLYLVSVCVWRWQK